MSEIWDIENLKIVLKSERKDPPSSLEPLSGFFLYIAYNAPTRLYKACFVVVL